MFLIVKHSHNQAIGFLAVTTIYMFSLTIVPTVLTAPVDIYARTMDDVSHQTDELAWLTLPCGNKNQSPLSVPCEKHKVHSEDRERIVIALRYAIREIKNATNSDEFNNRTGNFSASAHNQYRFIGNKTKKLLQHLRKLHRELQNITYIFYRLQHMKVPTQIKDPHERTRKNKIRDINIYIREVLCEVEQAINNTCTERLPHRIDTQELEEINTKLLSTEESHTNLQADMFKYLHQSERVLHESLDLLLKRKRKFHNQRKFRKGNNKNKHKKQKKLQLQQRHKTIKSINNKHRKQHAS